MTPEQLKKIMPPEKDSLKQPLNSISSFHWQVCPACNGCAMENPGKIFSNNIKCSVCNGKRIISTLTGKPPNVVDNESGVGGEYGRNNSKRM